MPILSPERVGLPDCGEGASAGGRYFYTEWADAVAARAPKARMLAGYRRHSPVPDRVSPAGSSCHFHSRRRRQARLESRLLALGEPVGRQSGALVPNSTLLGTPAFQRKPFLLAPCLRQIKIKFNRQTSHLGADRQTYRYPAIVLLARLSAILSRQTDRMSSFLGETLCHRLPRPQPDPALRGRQPTSPDSRQNGLITPIGIGHYLLQRWIQPGNIARGQDGQPWAPRFCVRQAVASRGNSSSEVHARPRLLPLAPDPRGRRRDAFRGGLAQGELAGPRGRIITAHSTGVTDPI